MVTIAGLDDNRLPFDAKAFPTPSIADPALQTTAYDVRTSPAEDLMRMYIAYNICNGALLGVTHAPAGRLAGFRTRLRVSPASGHLGTTMTQRARFDNLGELLNKIAAESTPQLGWRIVQVDDELEFSVYQPTDRSGFIRLDVANGTLNEQSVEFAPPEITRSIPAGQGDLEKRKFLQVTTAASLAAEAAWGLVIEDYKDQRQTNDTTELTNAALGDLNERGFTKVAVKAVPSNDQTMIFMTDFFMGDKVAVVIDGQEQPNSHITEAAVVVDENGLQSAVAIGDIADFDSSSALRQTVSDNTRKIAQLETAPALLVDRIGSGGKQITNWNDAVEPGFYWADPGTLNSPTAEGRGIGIVSVKPAGNLTRVMQDVTYPSVTPSVFTKTYRRLQNMSDGTWTEWRALGAGPTRGSASDMAALTPEYLDEWYNTTDGLLYIGSKSGTWRRKSGVSSFASAAWDTTQASAPAQAARTISMTIPTVLETNEYPMISLVGGGSGYTFLGLSSFTRGASNTTVNLRYGQLFSTTQQAGSFAWLVTPA
jgi:hypothetical protein